MIAIRHLIKKSSKYNLNPHFLRRTLLVLVTCLVVKFCVSQQGIVVNTGGFSSGIAGISAVTSGANALFTNFSATAGAQSSLFHLSTARRFNLSELSSYSAGAAVPLSQNGVIGFELSTYGFELFQDRFVAVKYAHRLSENFAISGSLGFDILDLGDFGQKSTLSYQIGISSIIVEGLRFGFTTSNIDGPDIEAETRLVSDIRVGFAYEVSDKVELLAELDKPLADELNVKVGIDYKLHQKLSIRSGYNTSPGQTSFGFSYWILDNLKTELAALYDPVLGITPVLSIVRETSQKPKS